MGKTENEFFCGHLWEQGKREKNEDSLAFWYMKKGKENKILAVVCDGIGGLPEGEQASSYVVRQLAGWFMTRGYGIKKTERTKMILQQLCYQIHEEIKEYGKQKGIRLGTTMTILLMDNRKYLWLHCGDCRLYLNRNGKLKQLTKEDCEKNGAINKAVGVGEWNQLQIGEGRITKGDLFLLCTDGFYKRLEAEELSVWAKRKISNENQAERMLRQIYQKKIAMDERDNISALYLGIKRKSRGEW